MVHLRVCFLIFYISLMVCLRYSLVAFFSTMGFDDDVTFSVSVCIHSEYINILFLVLIKE